MKSTILLHQKKIRAAFEAVVVVGLSLAGMVLFGFFEEEYACSLSASRNSAAVLYSGIAFVLAGAIGHLATDLAVRFISATAKTEQGQEAVATSV